jgi:hypothetical protein
MLIVQLLACSFSRCNTTSAQEDQPKPGSIPSTWQRHWGGHEPSYILARYRQDPGRDWLRLSSRGPPSSYPDADNYQTKYLGLMGLRGKQPSDNELGECGRRVGLTEYASGHDSLRVDVGNTAQIMQAIFGAIWVDCGSVLEVARISKHLRLNDAVSL